MIPSFLVDFFLNIQGSEEEEMLHTHHRRGDFVFVCVLSMLASAGLLAEGTLLTPSVAKGLISYS